MKQMTVLDIQEMKMINGGGKLAKCWAGQIGGAMAGVVAGPWGVMGGAITGAVAAGCFD